MGADCVVVVVEVTACCYLTIGVYVYVIWYTTRDHYVCHFESDAKLCPRITGKTLSLPVVIGAGLTDTKNAESISRWVVSGSQSGRICCGRLWAETMKHLYSDWLIEKFSLSLYLYCSVWYIRCRIYLYFYNS